MPMPAPNPDAYRDSSENLILAATTILVLLVIAITSTATLCGSALFTVLMIGLAYFTNQSHHQELIKHAQPVTPEAMPNLSALVEECASRLGVNAIKTYVAPLNQLNAYTFGISDPKVVVVYAPLLKLMDADELRFVVGHELGHVRLGHTWLNSIIGGMAGIPSPFFAAAILHIAFRWWNRACEFSADRAGLLACGNPQKAISALVRIATGTASRHPMAIEQGVQKLEAEDDDVTNLVGELFASHPMMARRIESLRRWAASPEYQRLQAMVNSARRN
jgi:Zn-dependent protease with chaperone function